MAQSGSQLSEFDSQKEKHKVNDHSILRLTALAGLLVLPVLGANAQGTAAAAATAAPAKIGIINARRAIAESAEGKQAQAELQSKFAPRQNELEGLNKQIEDIRNRLRTGERTLSEEEKARLQRQGELLTRQLDRKNQEIQEDLNAEQADAVDRISRKMAGILDRFARENGYTAVFDASSQAQVVVYASDQSDITDEVRRLYDQAYPIKGGAPATTPAQQKPAAPRPAAPAQQKPPQQ